MSENLPSINLIKNKQISVFDKLLNWTLSIGRLIVILTEVIAVITFLYRFSLDDSIVNLHSTIKQKQNIIIALKTDEESYRNLQERLVIADKYSKEADKFYQNISKIQDLISDDVKINNLTINKDKISLGIDTPSLVSLSRVIDSLKAQQNVKSINIDDISNKSGRLSLSLTTMLK